ncbi:hypothetical protein SBC2_16020 [Caballeronia sp. SBC2]|nr:hypothetical protein SBC2_16020 [Caballeronia sp. SBC2]
MIRGNFDRYCGRDFRKNFGNFDFSRYIAYHNVINRIPLYRSVVTIVVA